HHLEAHKLLHRGMTYRCDRRGCSATFASPVYLKVHQSRTQPRADGQGCATKGKGFQRTIAKSLKANTKRQHKLIDSKAKRIENNIEVIEWKTTGKKPKLIENKRNSIEIKPKTSEIKPKSIESEPKSSKTMVQKNVAKDSQRDAKEFKVLDECDVSHGLNDKIKSNSVDDKHITSQSSGDNKLFDDWFVCKYKECGEWFANEESYVYHKRMHELVVKRRVQRTLPMTVPPVPRFVTISKSDRSHGVAIDKPTDFQHKCPVNGCDETFDSMHSLRSHQKRRHPKELPDVPWIQCQRTGCRFRTKMKADFNRHVANDHKKSAKAVPDTGPQLKPISHTLYRLYKSDDSSTVESTDRQFMCEIKECGQAFKTSYALDGHHKRKHPHSFPDIPWIDCRYKDCLFQSKCNIYMSSHMSRHKTVRSPPGPKSAKMSRAVKEWKYRCDSHGCDYATRFERNLSAHKRVRHPENSLSDRRVKSVGSVAHVSEYQCDRHGCDYTTRFKHILNEHQLSHSEDSRLKCGINECRKVYGSKTALMAHQKKRHPDECGAKSKDWWCDWDACRRVFNSEKALKLHMKAHTRRTCEAIPYRCDWEGCDQTFPIKSVLDVHLKEHLLAEDFGVPAPVFDDEMKVDVKQEPIDTMTVNVIQESIDDNIIEFNSNCNNNSNNNETTAATSDFKLMSESSGEDTEVDGSELDDENKDLLNEAIDDSEDTTSNECLIEKYISIGCQTSYESVDQWTTTRNDENNNELSEELTETHDTSRSDKAFNKSIGCQTTHELMITSENLETNHETQDNRESGEEVVINLDDESDVDTDCDRHVLSSEVSVDEKGDNNEVLEVSQSNADSETNAKNIEAINRTSGQYVCDWNGCWRQFKLKHQLEDHKHRHSDEIYRCDKRGCSAIFASPASLKAHQSRKHCKSFGQPYKTNTRRKIKVFKSSHKDSDETTAQLNLSSDSQSDGNESNAKTIDGSNSSEEIVVISADKQFLCNYDGCVDGFSSVEDLIEHRLKHIIVVPTVDDCPETTGSASPERPLYTCKAKRCQYWTRYKHNFKAHQSTHSSDLKCCVNECNQMFKSKYSFITHQKARHPETLPHVPWIECRHKGCQYRTKLMADFTRHSSRHTIPANGMHRYYTKPDRIHSTERPFKCKVSRCQQWFKYKNKLKEHQLSLHPRSFPGIPWIKCSHKGCQYKTKLNTHFNAHISGHTEDRDADSRFKLKCGLDGCDNVFNFKRQLIEHQLRVHAGDPGVQRDITGESANVRSVSRGLADKTPDKPFVCDFSGCAKRFSRKENLIKHKPSHRSTDECHTNTGSSTSAGLSLTQRAELLKRDGVYRCDSQGCEYTTRLLYVFKTHLLGHTADCIVYRCHWPGCEKTFLVKSYLWGHERDHQRRQKGLPVGSHPCHWLGCEYRTSKKGTLERHVLNTHQNGSQVVSKCKTNECNLMDRRVKSPKNGKILTEVNDKKSPSKRKRLNHLVCHWNGCEKRYKFRHHLEAHKLLHRGMTYRCDRRGCSATFASPVYLKVHQSRTQPRTDGQGCAAKGKGFQRTIAKSLKANTKRQHKLIDSKAKRIENNIEVIEWKTIGKKPKLIKNKRNSIEIKPKTSEIKPKSIESKPKISKTMVQKNVAKDSQRDAKEFKVLHECDVSHGLNDKITGNSVDDKHTTSQSSGGNKLFDDWFVCKYKECGEWFSNEESYVYHKRMHELVVKRRVQRTLPMTVPPVPRFVTISKSDRSHGVAIDKELLDVPWIQCQRTGCRFRTKMKVDFNRHVANDHKKPAKAVPDTGPQLKPISHTLYRLYKSDDSSTVESTDRQFMCEIKECGQAFKTSYALDGHHKRKHPHSFPDIPWIDCRYKGCLFQSKCNIYMSSHMSRHKTVRSPPGPKSAKMSRAAKEWKYRCDSHGCDYATRFERNLSAHKRVRHPENSLSDRRVKSVGSVAHVSEYQCDRHGCDYTTRFKHILNEHQLSHSADSELKCGINECRKVYGSKTALMAHQKKRHPDECGAKCKDWWCDWDACRRVFNSEKALKLHMKAHTRRTCEAIPYRCDWDGCDQTFSIKSVLDVHLKEHLLAEDFGVPAPVFDDEMKVDVKQEPIDTMTEINESFVSIGCQTCDESVDESSGEDTEVDGSKLDDENRDLLNEAIDDSEDTTSNECLLEKYISIGCQTSYESVDQWTTTRDNENNELSEELTERHDTSRSDKTSNKSIGCQTTHELMITSENLETNHETQDNRESGEEVVINLDDESDVDTDCDRHVLSSEVGVDEKGDNNEVMEVSQSNAGSETNAKNIEAINRTSGQYVCDWNGCWRQFKFKHQLEDHKHRHSDETYRCDKRGCSAIFASPASLKVHKSRKHCKSFGQPYKTNTRRKFKVFKSSHKDSDETTAQLNLSSDSQSDGNESNVKTIDGSNSTEEIVVISADKQFLCNYDGCVDGFSSVEDLIEHRLKHIIVVPTVDDCPETTGSSSPERPLYTCKAKRCKYWTRYKHNFKAHQSTHSSDLKCCVNECNQMFKSKIGFITHQKTRHPEALPHVPWIECRHKGCQYRTKLRADFTRHSSRHTIHANSVHRYYTKPDRIHSTERRFKCKVSRCQQWFKYKKKLKEHQLSLHPRTFPGIPWIKCSHKGCQYKTKLNAHFIAHINGHTEDRDADSRFKLKCGLDGCDNVFNFKRQLIEHQLQIHACDLGVQRDITGESANVRSVSRGLGDKTPDKPFVCDFSGCAKRFSRKENLIKHKSSHRSTDECHTNTGSPTSAGLSMTQRAELLKRDGVYRCDSQGCEYTTRLLYVFKTHLLGHTADCMLKCGVNGCDQRFNSELFLTSHQRRKHPEALPSVPWIQCRRTDCQFRTKCQSSMDCHKMMHSSIQLSKVRCEWSSCTQVFDSIELMKVHVNSAHTDQIDYRCSSTEINEITTTRDVDDHQERIFLTKHSLSEHQLSGHPDAFPDKSFIECMHTGCQYRTKVINYMNKHKTTHSMGTNCGDPGSDRNELSAGNSGQNVDNCHQFNCTINECQQTFESKREWIAHRMRAHPEEYVRELKSYDMSQQSSLTIELQFLCSTDGCNQLFNSEDNLTSHQLRLHPEAFASVPWNECWYTGCEFRTKCPNHMNAHKLLHTGIEFPTDNG
ncbi:unnamed protein product, partial [Oppiella nova]